MQNSLPVHLAQCSPSILESCASAGSKVQAVEKTQVYFLNCFRCQIVSSGFIGIFAYLVLAGRDLHGSWE